MNGNNNKKTFVEKTTQYETEQTEQSYENQVENLKLSNKTSNRFEYKIC